jgi:hypothetical protein
MKHQWLAYVIVALLSIAAGVAIAGLPNDVPVSATIVVPATTEVPETTVATTTTTVLPETTVATTAPPTTEAPATTVAPSTTVLEPTTTTVSLPLPDRDEVVSATANGAGAQGAASRVADQLEGLGYVDVGRFDGTEIVEFTIVYYSPGMEEAAERMAADLELLPQFIAPIAEAPEVVNPPLVQLLVYVGTDRGF